MIENEHFSIPAGDDQILEFQDIAADLANLDGCSVFWWCARSVEQHTDPTLQKIGVIIDSAAKKFRFTLARADTLALRGDFFYEAKVVDQSGNDLTVTQGMMTVQPTLIRHSGEV